MKTVTIDSRMLLNSGIGVYIKNITERIDGIHFHLKYIINEDLKNLKPVQSNKTVVFKSRIYTLKENLEYLCKVKKSLLFWSPHYNIPLVPIYKNLLVTIHDVYHLAFFNTLSLKQKIYAKVLINIAVNRSKKIITVSDFSKHEIIRYTGCSADKIVVIHNGCRQTAVHKSRQEIQAQYDLPPKYILYVGNVKPHKNLKVLIEAYKLLPEQIKNEYSIVIVGKKEGFITGDNQLVHLVAKDQHLGKSIHFTGYVPDEDIDSIYKYASLFVFPSIYEGFGLPPLEAMLNECPVISSNAASMPEVCGDGALYFSPTDPQELGQKITEVLLNPEVMQDLIRKGKERVKIFSWEKCAAEHIEVINSILN